MGEIDPPPLPASPEGLLSPTALNPPPLFPTLLTHSPAHATLLYLLVLSIFQRLWPDPEHWILRGNCD